MDPLHATIEEFAAEGYTHVECFCPRCRGRSIREGSLTSCQPMLLQVSLLQLGPGQAEFVPCPFQ